MVQTPLSAQKRSVLGRKVKTLRKDGFIPAHVFGHKIKTIHIQVKSTEFGKVFEKVGETGLVELTIDSLSSEAPSSRGAKGDEKRPVLVRNVQIHPVTDEPLHIDFYQVNLAEKVTVNIPLEIIGEAPAVGKKIGLLLTPVSEIEIEALPSDIPEKIVVDVTKLENIGDEIKVKDFTIDRAKIEVKTDAELVVAQIGELVTKEMEAVEAEIEAEQAEAVAEAAPAEGVAPAEGAATGEPRPEGREEAKDEGAEAPAGEEKPVEEQPAKQPQTEQKEEPKKE